MQQQEETENIEFTEEHLQAIYLYIAMHYDDMDIEEQVYWNYVLEKIDPEYDKEL